MEEKPIVDFEIEGDLEAQERLKDTGHTLEGRATVHVIAQSHLDLMWKWDRHDVRDMIYRTFAGHADLLEQHPEYTYAQSQLFLYDYVRRHFPELFRRVQALVREGRWEVVGGQWVEADGNLLDDESSVRQFLVGQGAARALLGVTARTGWCPDGFGTHRNLPQLLAGAGIGFYVHKRPRHRFLPLPATPYRLMGLDGTQVCALRSNNKGIGLPRVSEGESFEGTEIEYIRKANEALGLEDLWGPLGCGDTGGVNDVGEVPRDRFPSVDFVCSTPQRFFAAVQGKLAELPVVTQELNFEFPACYTTHADIKQGNRLCERLLNEAEFLCTLSAAQGMEYPAETLAEAWKLVLYNQFHDGVTGTGLDRVHAETLRDYAAVQYRMGQIIEEARLYLEQRMDTGAFARPVVVYNPNAFETNAVLPLTVTISRPAAGYVLKDANGQAFPCVVVSDELLDGNGNYHRMELVCEAPDLPALGWKVFDLAPEEAPAVPDALASVTQLENTFWRVELDGHGDIITLFDKARNCAVNAPDRPFAELQLLCEGNYVLDYGRPHKAWNFGFDGRRVATEYAGAEVTECNAVRTVLRQRFGFGQSWLTRDIILPAAQPLVEFRLELDWQETETYLGMLFPLNMGPDAELLRRIPFGQDLSPTGTGEFPSLNYVMKRDSSSAVALMTRDRYGFSEPETGAVRLSLIRCSTDYDNRSDSGRHVFEFAVASGLPGDFDALANVCEAYRRPPMAALATAHRGGLAPLASAVQTGDPRILVSALKRAERSGAAVLRLFNRSAESIEATVTVDRALLPFGAAARCNLLEDEGDAIAVRGDGLALSFRGYEIITVLLKD